MSANFSVGAEGDALYNNTTPITDTPYSISVWLNIPNQVNNNVFAAGLASASNNWAAACHTSAERPQLQICASGTNDAITESTDNFQNVWGHMLCVYSSDTSRELFVNGTSRGTDTSSRNPAAHTGIWLGNPVLGALTDSSPYQGLIAHVAYYDAALDVNDAADLYNGGSGGAGQNPLDQASSANLVAYYPLDTDFDLTDHAGARDLTNSDATNIVYSSNNPNVDAPASGGSAALFARHLMNQMGQ